MEDVDSFRILVVAPGVAVSGGWGVLCWQSLFLPLLFGAASAKCYDVN